MLIHFEKLAYDLFPRVTNRLLVKLALLIVPYVSLQFSRLFYLLPVALRGEANRLPFVRSIRTAIATELDVTISEIQIENHPNENVFSILIAKTLARDRIDDIRKLIDGYRLAGTRIEVQALV